MGNAWILWVIGMVTLPFQWLAHILGHSYPAEHQGCRWCGTETRQPN